MNEQEVIRRAYYIEKQSQRQIARERHHTRRTIAKIVEGVPRKVYQIRHPKEAPVFGKYRERVEELLQANEQMPRKQRYTSTKIVEILRQEGYTGCASRVRQHIAKWKREHQAPKVYLPLEFAPGQDAQVDWGQAQAIIAGKQQTVHVFVMRLCYSRKLFVMAFPSETQESFFAGHVQAFAHFQGVPHRLSYDNLGTAVQFIEHRKRQENPAFVAFRSHYLFASHFCTPEQGHEKGQVEHGVGFSRRTFMVPIPHADSFEDLNAFLLAQCQHDDQREVDRQPTTIGQMWEEERPLLRPLPAVTYECCVTTQATLTPYSQVIFATNRYSVPVDRARRQVTIKATPFFVEILDGPTLLARHRRCFERQQDILEPLHYLPLLLRRPGAFDSTKPIQTWRKDWPASYEQMLARLREKWPDGRGVKEFVRILQLHEQYPFALVCHAIELALRYGCVHLDGVQQCLYQLTTPSSVVPALDVTDRPQLALSAQPLNLTQYDQLLTS